MSAFESLIHTMLKKHGRTITSKLHALIDPHGDVSRSTFWRVLKSMQSRAMVIQDRHGHWCAIETDPHALDDSAMRQLQRIYRALGTELTSVYASGVHITTAPRHFEDVLAGRFDRSADMGTLVRAVIAARAEAARVRAPSRDSGIRGVAA